MVQLVDLVKITCNSTGPGAITLGGAVPGYRGVEVLTNGGVYSYAIQQDTNYEFGRGTYLAAGRQLIRSPIDSSKGGTALDLQPNAAISLVLLAEDINTLINETALLQSVVAAANQAAIDASALVNAAGGVQVAAVTAAAAPILGTVVRTGVSNAPLTTTSIGDATLTGSGYSDTSKAYGLAQVFDAPVRADSLTVGVTAPMQATMLILTPLRRVTNTTASYTVAYFSNVTITSGVPVPIPAANYPAGTAVFMNKISGGNPILKSGSGLTFASFDMSDFDGTVGDTVTVSVTSGAAFAMQVNATVIPQPTLAQSAAKSDTFIAATTSTAPILSAVGVPATSDWDGFIFSLEEGFDVGTDIPAGQIVSGFQAPMSVSSGEAAYVSLSLFSRDTASAGIDSNLTAGTQTEIATYHWPIAALGLVPDAAKIMVTLPVDPFIAVGGKTYFYSIWGSKADQSAGYINFRNATSSDSRQRARGFYNGTTGVPPGYAPAVNILGYAKASAPSTATVAYGDRITAATVTPSTFALSTSLTLLRNGTSTSYTDARTITAAASGKVRYDVLYLDLEALTFGVQAGTERASPLADASLFIPTMTTATRLPVANLRVASAAVTDAIPVWNVFDGEVRDLSAQLEAERRRSRQCIQKFRNAIRRRDPQLVAWIGNSRGAIYNVVNVQPIDSPNGPTRDVALEPASAPGGTVGYLSGPRLIGSDYLATVPLVTAAQMGRAADTNGAIYSMISVEWRMLRAIQSVCGYALGAGGLRGDNWCIAGSSTNDLVSGSGPSTWLANCLATSPNLLIIDTTMNDFGLSAATIASNLVIAINAAKAAGIEVMVTGVERKNASQSSTGYDSTNRAIREAAYATGAAFVPSVQLYDPAFGGAALGVAPSDYCMANGINHRGPLEQAAIAREWIKMVLG